MSALPAEIIAFSSLRDRRAGPRRSCLTPTFIQVIRARQFALHRARIYNIAESGIGLLTQQSLPLGPALVELPMGLNRPLRLARVKLRHVTPVGAIWLAGGEFAVPLDSGTLQAVCQ